MKPGLGQGLLGAVGVGGGAGGDVVVVVVVVGGSSFGTTRELSCSEAICRGWFATRIAGPSSTSARSGLPPVHVWSIRAPIATIALITTMADLRILPLLRILLLVQFEPALPRLPTKPKPSLKSVLKGPGPVKGENATGGKCGRAVPVGRNNESTASA